MTNLLDGVKDLLTDSLINKATEMIGIESSSATSAIGKFLPAIIGGLISKGNTESGAGALIDLFKNGGYGADNLKDLVGIFGDSQKSKSWLESGGDLLGAIFGNNQSSLIEKLVGMTGLKKAGGSMLMKFLAPIVINKLAGMVFKNNWGADKLSSYLSDQKSSISSLVPGLSGLLGFAESSTASGDLSEKVAAATSISETTPSGAGGSGGGSGIWKWLLPILAIALIAWYLTKDGCNKSTEVGDGMDNAVLTAADDVEEMDNDEMKEMDTETMENDNNEPTVVASSVDYSGYSVADDGSIVDANGAMVYKDGAYGLDANNNLIDENGNVLIRSSNLPTSLLEKLKVYLGKYAGTKLTEDESGNLVDSNGKIIFKNGEYVKKGGFYYDKEGNKLGRIWAKIVAAVKDAATATVESMKGFFTDMVTKKEGAKTNYALSNIEFGEDGNRITSFSKAEVEGLAAALKENQSGKIAVTAYTNDGSGDRENKNLSKNRAQVVHDMLVTLGVPKGQISFEGGGSGNNRVEVSAK